MALSPLREMVMEVERPLEQEAVSVDSIFVFSIDVLLLFVPFSPL